MFEKLFKQGKPEVDQQSNDELPASLEAALEGMNITPRETYEDEKRVILHFSGENASSWFHSNLETKKRILQGWPGLSELQLEQAMRAIKGNIRSTLTEAAPHRQKSNWAKNEYRPRGMFTLPGDKNYYE